MSDTHVIPKDMGFLVGDDKYDFYWIDEVERVYPSAYQFVCIFRANDIYNPEDRRAVLSVEYADSFRDACEVLFEYLSEKGNDVEDSW